MKVKLIHIDYFIVFLITYVLLIDALTGFLKLSGSDLPSISQIYKTGLLFLIIARILNKGRSLFIVFILFLFLIIPSIIQLIKSSQIHFFEDVLKLIKYLTPMVFYFYFIKLFKFNNPRLNEKLFLIIKVSYIILVVNLLLKFVGLGYSVYSGNIGSKGYFYAGNEISGVLIITYAVISYELLLSSKIKSFWLLFVFTVNIAFLLSSKTAVFGIILMTLFIKFKPFDILKSIKKIKKFIVFGLLFLPIGIYFLYNMILSSDVFQNRIMFFYKRMDMDLFTLILSSRNIFFKDAFDVYLNDYNFLEKMIGVGQSSYKMKTDKTVEIEFVDIFFTYGFFGFLIFFCLLSVMFYISFKKKKNPTIYPYARLTYLVLLILVIISSIAGHIFSSGMAGIFIGYIIAKQHLKKII